MSRTCTICSHPDLGSIDAALVTGEPYRSIANRFEASSSAVYRHQQDHLPVTLVKAAEAGEVAHADSLRDQLQCLHQKALDILAGAEKAGDLRTALMALQEVRSTMELTAKVTGELVNRRDSPDSQALVITKVEIVVAGRDDEKGAIVDGQVVSEDPES